MKIHEHNASTGEIIEREATPEELANAKNAESESEARQLEQENKAAARQAVYAKLGLSADEIAALAD
jgi:predicted GIY-YIG superfamily endonuclease